jgi:large subunit ribosomal protein L15e
MAEEATPPAPAEEGEKPPSKPKNLYGNVRAAWKRPRSGVLERMMWERMVEWRRGPTFERVNRPTRIDRARALGYRAKPGFVVVRTRVRRGGLRKPAIKSGRRAKRYGRVKLTMGKSIQRIAEERVNDKYPNLEVLNSYWVGEDGRHKYYEIILVDPAHPAIAKDKTVGWVAEAHQSGRANRGLTSAGKRGRGLRHRGKGSEKVRPSVGANLRKTK